MGLQNLVGMSLEQITPAKETVKRLLDAAARRITDAKVDAISAETRFASATLPRPTRATCCDSGSVLRQFS